MLRSIDEDDSGGEVKLKKASCKIGNFAPEIKKLSNLIIHNPLFK